MFSTVPNEFEPFRKDLWSIEFPVEMNIPEVLQVSAARPKVSNPRKGVMYKNLQLFYKGKTEVDEMQIVFRDAIGTSIYQKLQQWQRQHTDFATGQGGYTSTYKKTLVLNMEDPTGAVLQKFTLFGCFLTSLDGGDLSMEDDSIAQVTIGVSYDTYELEFA